MRACLEAAIAAPSVHNSQPWLFRPHDTSVDLLVDRRRQLTALDPDGREMYISVGAALLNLRLAIGARARWPRVRLLPDPHRPDLAATVQVGPAVPVPPAELLLAQAIHRRRSNREPFARTAVPKPPLELLVAAAVREGASLLVVDSVSRSRVLRLAAIAEAHQRRDPRYRAELTEWTEPTPGRTDGIPPKAFGPRPAAGMLPIRDFSLNLADHRPTARYEPEPTIAVLYAPRDDPLAWLRSGQALQRILLTATAVGLASTLLTQPVEVAPLRRLFAAPHDARTAQAVLRLGYAGPGPRTPRRPLADALVADES